MIRYYLFIILGLMSVVGHLMLPMDGNFPLNMKEMGSIFGLPSVLQSDNLRTNGFYFVPFHILDSLLHPLVNECEPSEYQCLRRRKIHNLGLPLDKTPIIPSLGQFMPHDWCAPLAEVDFSVKSSDADIIIHHWDKRISWLRHNKADRITNVVLPRFRKMIMRRLWRMLYLEYCVYMTHIYGLDWSAQLTYLRRQESLMGKLGGIKRTKKWN